MSRVLISAIDVCRALWSKPLLLLQTMLEATLNEAATLKRLLDGT